MKIHFIFWTDLVYYGRTKVAVGFTKRLFSPRYYSQKRNAYCAGRRMYDSRLIGYTKQEGSAHCADGRMDDSRLVRYTQDEGSAHCPDDRMDHSRLVGCMKQKGSAYCTSNRMHDTCLVKSTCTIVNVTSVKRICWLKSSYYYYWKNIITVFNDTLFNNY